MMSVTINAWAVLVAALVNMVVGTLWYSPTFFGKTWSGLIGHKMEDMRKNGGTSMMVAVLVALVQAFILAHFVRYANATTVVSGAAVALMLWVGFVGATSGLNTAFAGRPWKLWAIDSGYFLVVMLINGALLASWR